MNSKGTVASTSLSVGLATGVYAISFGALSTVAGLNFWQTMALSLLMFSGGSQFAFVGVVASAGVAGLPGAIASAWLLGIRNGFYGLTMSKIAGARGLRKLVAAQLTIDESTAVALGQSESTAQRKGFWLTGMYVYIFWNSLTAVGVFAGSFIGDPKDWGLDAAAAAAFVGLVWPRLVDMLSRTIAGGALVVAIICSTFMPAGWPVLTAGAFGAAVAFFSSKRGDR